MVKKTRKPKKMEPSKVDHTEPKPVHHRDSVTADLVKPDTSDKFLRTSKLPNKRLALIFVALFAIAGVYLVYRLFAATTPMAVVEAESLALPAGGSVLSDSTASATQAIKLTTNGTATGTVVLPTPATSLTVRAKGIQCKGAPQMVVKVDGLTVLTSYVSATGWSEAYTANVNLSATSHSLSVDFTNNNSWKNCSRDLFVDKLTFFGTSTDPTPTPSVTPSPTPISTSDLLNRKDLIYSSEIGAWTKNGTPAVTLSTGIPQKVIDAKMPVIRYAQYDCWTDQRCGSDNHVGTQVRADFNTAMGGIVNNMHAVPWLKLLPIAVGNIQALPNGNVFCPPWTGDATQNLKIYESQLDQLATFYKGPLIIESNNEMEYTCWETWKSQGANIGGAGSAGVSKRIGEHFAQNMPTLKKYARNLGFSQVVVVGYIGVGGGGINGDTWGDRCTADSTKPYGYACTYNPRWVDEFNKAVHDAYVAAGSNDPDYIPDAEAIHAYVHSPDFIPKTSTSTYEFDDKIAYSYYRNWLVQSRARTKAIWGTTVGDQIRFSISEWQAGASNNDGVWSGWSTPSRVQAFYDGWLKMLQGDGNLTGAGTRYWNANVFLLASEGDTGISKYYNIVRQDGSTPLWYDTFKMISLGDTAAR